MVKAWIFKEWIIPTTIMGFVRENYLDVYAAALRIVVCGSSWILFIIGKLVIRNLYIYERII